MGHLPSMYQGGTDEPSPEQVPCSCAADTPGSGSPCRAFHCGPCGNCSGAVDPTWAPELEGFSLAHLLGTQSRCQRVLSHSPLHRQPWSLAVESSSVSPGAASPGWCNQHTTSPCQRLSCMYKVPPGVPGPLGDCIASVQPLAQRGAQHVPGPSNRVAEQRASRLGHVQLIPLTQTAGRPHSLVTAPAPGQLTTSPHSRRRSPSYVVGPWRLTT